MMMIFEYLLYIVITIIVVIVGERYKNMHTIKYTLFISSVLLAALLVIAVMDGGFLIPLKFVALVFILGVSVTTFLFHMQKRSRGIK